MKKRKKVIKGIISYILALAMTIFFALYLNATVGWFMLVALILALVLSVFFALFSAFLVNVDCEMEDCILAKGDTCHMSITIQNKSLFPTTPLEIEVLNGDGVKSDKYHILISLLPFEKQTIEVTFRAKICGPSVVGIKSVKATDYLGLLAFKIHRIHYEKLKRNVAVIPDMADVSPRDDKILKVMQASLHTEDGDDTVEVSSNTFGGFPGCDNREYIPGDPLKRVNWKQSAKRGKLLVRLDDVLASKSVNLVLDSVFLREFVEVNKMSEDPAYAGIPQEDLYAKIAEDAVETALGIARTLVLSSYTVNFFVAKEAEFERYDLEDEKDIEAMRLMLADYGFDQTSQKERFPKNELLDQYTSFIFCTPNDYKEVFVALKEGEDASGMSIFSIIGDVSEKNEHNKQVLSDKSEKKVVSKKEKRMKLLGTMIIPYLLAVVSGVTIFAVFGVSPFSYWTVLQAIVCAGIFALCQYAKEHKVVGGALISIVIVVALFFFSRVAFSGVEYLQWFMSGADTIDNKVSYLMSLILVFTLLFAMVLFYYTQIYYRTTAILMVTIIPYIIYVKLIREVGIGYVMLAIVLNVATFLINIRRQRDKGKWIVGYKRGIASLVMYAVCFILIALAVPKGTETKYYHFFEEWFLGGNTSIPVPEEYGDKSDYSGNADNFNELTNRQLYNIYGADLTEALYLRRQVFDYYDFENHRWYDDDKFSAYTEQGGETNRKTEYMSNEALLDAICRAEEISPGFLQKYGMESLQNASFSETISTASVSAKNFESFYLLTPDKTLNILIYGDRAAFTNKHRVYGRDDFPFGRYISYYAEYISEFKAKEDWISIGGSNMDYDTSYEMLAELVDILSRQPNSKEVKVAEFFYADSQFAKEYAKACSENTALISDEVKELALEITKDCTYEWEKAEALENYFKTEGFIYDLEYDAPDDSVEYFLFEGKTGTCSDFASAYVLLARAAGLTVRYAEGFVPTREVSYTYEWQYVVRTRDAHAYPEVYIPNLGFVVYEPTVGGFGGTDLGANAGVIGYLTTLVLRVVAILAAVAFVIALILLVCRIIAPAIKEKSFMKKVEKADSNVAVTMLYQRILERYSQPHIKETTTYTPYEYAEKFEKIFEFDISPLTFLVEKAAYENTVINEQDRIWAKEMYLQAKKVVKEYKGKKKEGNQMRNKAE